MFTIIDTHTNESIKRSDVVAGEDDSTDPVLFDTEAEAADWAAGVSLDGSRYAIVDIDDILNTSPEGA
jgi:hypothetical protein